MNGLRLSIAALALVCTAIQAQTPSKSVAGTKTEQANASAAVQAHIDLAAPSKVASAGRAVKFSQLPLSFEPNVGQSRAGALFTAKGREYTLELERSRMRFQLPETAAAGNAKALDLEMVNASRNPEVRGKDQLPGKDNYFPTPDPKTWFSNIPTFGRVGYSAIYPGVDISFYGNSNRMEYDFTIQPTGDPSQIQMKLTGADQAHLDKDGDLVLTIGKGELRFLAPVAYQNSADGKHRDSVRASYELAETAKGQPPVVRFALGDYDRTRTLVIDPTVVPAFTYSEYLPSNVADVTADNSGNTYVTGQTYNAVGFYVEEFNASGTLVYTTNVGTGTISPFRVRVDSNGNAYVAGQTNGGSALPTGPNSYQSTVTAYYNGFLVEIASGGGSVPYATFIGGTDTGYSYTEGLAVQTISGVTYAFLDGATESATFPTTAGVYQSTLTASSYAGWVARFNPSASGAASLQYSTFLGSIGGGDTQLYALAVDSSGDTYVTGNTSSSGAYPVTSGAFQYDGYYAGDGGVYVTELNPTGTSLVYSAYLGYGSGYGIAVDGAGNAYVDGVVNYEDFPTTAGAYQTSYPGAFVVKLNAGGATEAYSTFLGGPSATDSNVVPWSIALENGCSSSCNAYVSGWTSTTDFPAVNPIQTAPSTSGYSAFVTELNATGTSALFSSYLSGLTGYVWSANNVADGWTPAIAVDNSGNMSVVGNLGGTADFPITLSNANPSNYAFLAKIGSSSSPFTWDTPTSLTFPNQPVGVSTSVYGTPQVVTIRNLSATAATISSVQIEPTSIFSASDSCGTVIPAGGVCQVTVNFQPNEAGTRVGTLTVTSNASNSPIIVPLTGTGVDNDFLTQSANSLTFASQTVATSSAPQTVTLTNIGTTTATLNVYMQNGTDFSVLNGCAIPLPPGSSCQIVTTFTPTEAGLRTDTIYATFPEAAAYIYIPVSGTGLPGGATGTVNFSATAIDFGSEPVGQTTTYQGVYLENNSSDPFTVTAITASGDFSIYSTNCGAVPFVLLPQNSCIVYTTFTPSAAGARTGTLAFTDTAAASPQSVALSGNGVASSQTLEFYPSPTVDFGSNVPVGVQSGTLTAYVQNAGSEPVVVTRVLASGDFHITYSNCPGTLAGTTQDGTGSLSYCQVNLVLIPTATGLRTGTLTFIDNASSSPQTLALQGNAIADSGAIDLIPTALPFVNQAVGTTSAVQYVEIYNPGNDPITINSYSNGTGSFSVTNYDCPALPFTLTAGDNCYVTEQFTPASATSLTDKLTVTGSVTTETVALSGTGVAESKTIGFTPASPMNSGSVQVGQSSGTGSSDDEAGDLVSIRNTGTAAVTFSANPAVGGANEADFSLYNPYSCGTSGTQLQPGASCPMWITFKPSVAAAETATLTFADDATGTTQVLTLKGTGIAAWPNYYASNNLLNYDNQAQGTTSPTNTYLYFYNNSGAAVTLGNAVVSSGFLIPSGEQSCNGATIASGGSCYYYVSFAPTSPGLITGTITIKNNASATLLTIPLTGYAPSPVTSGSLIPATITFATPQVKGSTSSYQSTVFTNTGNVPLTIGTITGTNFGATPTNEFSIYSDGCGGETLNPAGTCTEYVEFTPNALGARTGTLNIPVTYTGGSTATFTANLSGTGIAEVNSAILEPGNGTFVDQTVGVVTNYTVTLYLVNQGNQPFKVGTLTGVNTIVGSSNPTGAEFSTSGTQGGSDGCTGQQVAATTGYCAVSVAFTPSTTGTQTGSISFPVTFADNTTTTVTANLSGLGVAAAPRLQFKPASVEFPPEIESNTSSEVAIAVTNIGNTVVHFSSSSTPSAGFGLGPDGDGCFALSAQNLAVNQTCYVYVDFAPTTTGSITGTLIVHDNATGGPHTIPLSGTGILASQQIALSQTALTFATQPQGSSSSPQVVYINNQGDTTVTSLSATLGGTNSADFMLTNSCSTSLAARSICSLTVTFSPLSTSTGIRTATVTVADSDSGSPRTITLTGTAVVAGPAVALAPPSPLTFPLQVVGTTSGIETFSVTNTGSANLTVTSVALSGTNASEFSIAQDGCSGAVLTPSQNCFVGLRFSPALGGTRTAVASVTDSATGSPHTIAISGLGYGNPISSLSTSSLAFGDVLVPQTSSAMSVTLTNPGTDTLKISSITLTGPEASYFSAPVTTCGTTLAPAGSCTISTKFTANFLGPKYAEFVITDNANNVAGSTQTVSLFGIGVANPSTATVTSSLNPSIFGQSVTFTVTVTSAVAPTGSVNFIDGSTTIHTATLTGGVATFTTSTLYVGTHAITVHYFGGNDLSTTSAPLLQVVNPPTTTTALTSSLNPSTYGASVTFTATVTPSIGATPTGYVNFILNGGTTIGTQALSGGVATFTTTTLPVGTDSIEAHYYDGNDQSSTSSPVSQVVNLSPTSTALTSSLNPSTSGASVTFTATVTATTGPTPTGTVTFKNGSTTLGTGTLSSGVATYTTTTLPAGTDSITAGYGGSSTDASSTSTALSQVVNP